jgi:hypothetical protein
LRARLVDAIDQVTCVRDLEPLARRLDVISAEISGLAPLAESSPVDEILARRAERARRAEPVAPSHAVTRGTQLHG